MCFQRATKLPVEGGWNFHCRWTDPKGRACWSCIVLISQNTWGPLENFLILQFICKCANLNLPAAFLANICVYSLKNISFPDSCYFNSHRLSFDSIECPNLWFGSWILDLLQSEKFPDFYSVGQSQSVPEASLLKTPPSPRCSLAYWVQTEKWKTIDSLFLWSPQRFKHLMLLALKWSSCNFFFISPQV